MHTGSDWIAHVRDVPMIVVLRFAGTPVVAELHGSVVEGLSGAGHFAFKALSRFMARRVTSGRSRPFWGVGKGEHERRNCGVL